jgi:hypothetical protein
MSTALKKRWTFVFVRKNTTRKSEFIQLTRDTIHPIHQASVSGLAGKILVMFK